MLSITVAEIINTIIISIGIGVCGMSILQVSFGARLKKQVTMYFQLFFSMILMYITCHLIRQFLEGNPSDAVGFWIRAVTFLEFVASGVMAWLFSLLTLYVSKSKNARQLNIVLLIFICCHVAVMVINLFTGLCYTYDEANIYHRSGGYLFSNLFILIMLVVDIVLLIRYKDNFNAKIKPAFWLYIIAPIVAIVIQAFPEQYSLLSLQQLLQLFI